MRDAMRDPEEPGLDLVAEPACCPGGACGPLFETPLLEQAFNRLRGLVIGRSATTVAQTPTVATSAVRPQDEASHD